MLHGYADRPVLGQRAVDFVTDPATGRTEPQLRPRFDTISYRELADRVDAAALVNHVLPYSELFRPNVVGMMLSLVATGIAPRSFYDLDADGNRQRVHYDGLPVEFIAEAVATLGARAGGGFATYHVMNPHDDGIGMDEFVDWLVDAGYPIQRIDDYREWVQRFETSLPALPEKQRQASLLPAAAQLPEAAAADPRVDRADRPAPARVALAGISGAAPRRRSAPGNRPAAPRRWMAG